MARSTRERDHGEETAEEEKKLQRREDGAERSRTHATLSARFYPSVSPLISYRRGLFGVETH